MDRASVPVTNGLSGILVDVTDNHQTSNGNYMIQEGETETFEMSVIATLPTAGNAGLYRAALTGIKWDTEDNATLGNTYASNLDTFKTDYIVLN